MKAENLDITSTVVAYPVLKELIESHMVYAIDFGDSVSVCSSWLVDLTPEQEAARKDLEINLTNRSKEHD